MEINDDSFLVTNIVNFSSEEMPVLPHVHVVDANNPASFSVEVDLFILIEPEVEWLVANEKYIKSRKSLTIILTTPDKKYLESDCSDIVDNILTVKSGRYKVFISDLIRSLTDDHIIGVDFGDFRTVMRQGGTASLYSGGYTKDDHFYMHYFEEYFLESIDYTKLKAIFIIIYFSMDFVHDLEDFEGVSIFFGNQFPDDSNVTFVVTGLFTNDPEGARVSAILID